MSDENASDEDWVSVAEAAALMKVSPRTVRRRCEAGEIIAELEASENGTGGLAWRIDATSIAVVGNVENDRAAKRTDTNQAQNQTARTKTMAARTGARPSGRTEADGQMWAVLVAEKDARIDDLREQLEAAREKQQRVCRLKRPTALYRKPMLHYVRRSKCRIAP